MGYVVYLLNISQWLQKVNRENSGLMLEEDSARYALTLISKERAEKVIRAKTPLGQAHSLGAGLLLQYVWQRGQELSEENKEGSYGKQICFLSIEQTVTYLNKKQPSQIPMTYGSKGKPYFAESTQYFSLSHSGDYVLCAVAKREIGADIQQCKTGVKESLVKRVLTKAELEEWQGLQQAELAKDVLEVECSGEALKYFYRKWTEKEAYGKLTGDGVFELLGKEKLLPDAVCLESTWELPGYCISLCQYNR